MIKTSRVALSITGCLTKQAIKKKQKTPRAKREGTVGERVQVVGKTTKRNVNPPTWNLSRPTLKEYWGKCAKGQGHI